MSATTVDTITVANHPATFFEPAADFSDGIEILRAYHIDFLRHGTRLLTLAGALRAQWSRETHNAEARALVDYYERATGLHHRDEERALFPQILNRSFLVDGMIERLAMDHTEIEELWGQLRQALTEQRPAPLPLLDLATRFERSLRTHIEREDLDFFPLVERLLSPEQRSELGARMALLRR